MQLLRLATRSLRPYAWLVVAALVLQLVQVIASLTLPSLQAGIVDDGIAKGDLPLIWRTGLVMLGVTLVQIAASIAAVWFGAGASMRMGRDLHARVFGRVQSFSEQELGRFGAPSLITRTMNDVMQVQTVVYMVFTIMVNAPIQSIGGIVMAIRQDIGMSWLIVVLVVVMLVAIGIVVARMLPIFRGMQERVDGVNRVLREQLAGIRVVRAFVRESHEQERFGEANARVTELALRAGRLFSLTFPLVFLILNGGSVAVLWFGAHGVAAGTTQIGAVMAFLQYLVQILMGVMMAVMMSMMLPRAAVSADRISAVLETESSVVPPAEPVRELSGAGTVEFRDVGFHYPGASEPVLDGISFTARAGETTAIIGSTGSGNTTCNLRPC